MENGREKCIEFAAALKTKTAKSSFGTTLNTEIGQCRSEGHTMGDYSPESVTWAFLTQ